MQNQVCNYCGKYRKIDPDLPEHPPDVYWDKGFCGIICLNAGEAIKAGVMPDNRQTDKRQGDRYNQGKDRPDLIPVEVLIALGKHYAYGAKKYAPNNWRKGFPYSETSGSLLRHLYAWLGGEQNDPESGTHHLVAVIWNAITLFYFELYPQKYSEFDDRPILIREFLNVPMPVDVDRTRTCVACDPHAYHGWSGKCHTRYCSCKGESDPASTAMCPKCPDKWHGEAPCLAVGCICEYSVGKRRTENAE